MRRVQTTSRPRCRLSSLLVMLALVCGLPAKEPPPGRVDEYSVKAAFLFNFAKFVRWPEARSAADMPIIVGVYGEDPFGPLIEAVLLGKTAHGRKLEIERFRAMEGLERCHVLFVNAASREELKTVIRAVHGLPVLTVGDSKGFALSGGVVELVLQDRKVRFDINTTAAAKSGLKISSQILKLARRGRQD